MNDSPTTLNIKDGLVAAPPASVADASSSIRVPQVDVALGADFGSEITDDNREFAAQREPIAGFLIYGIAKTIVEKWFTINNKETKEADPALDEQIQTQMRTLKYKTKLRRFIEYKRLYGNTLMVGSFDDAHALTELANELSPNATLKFLEVFQKNKYSVLEKDENPESFRYGQPTVYQVVNGSVNYRVHWTRCYEHIGSSILDLIWDDLTCGRNIRWGVAQWIYRTGGGFAVIKFPKEYSPGTGQPVIPTTPAKLQEWAASASFNDITHKKYICIINETMDFKFEGAAGSTLNPEPFFDTNTAQIAKATGYPKSILEGAEAGALTGSEKNDQQFYKQISGEQGDLEDVNRWVIDHILKQNSAVPLTVSDSLKPVGSVLRRMLHKVAPTIVKDAPTVIDYNIEWVSAFEVDAEAEARTDLLTEQANEKRLLYRTPDEVRELQDPPLPPLPNGEGAKLKQAAVPTINDPSQQDPNNPQAKEENPDLTQPKDSAVPSIKTLLQPIILKVYNNTLSHDSALSQGNALIEYYIDYEKTRALQYTQSRLGNGVAFLSPEQENQFAEDKLRYQKDFLTILTQTEKLAAQPKQ